jgi:hypothetical protein
MYIHVDMETGETYIVKKKKKFPYEYLVTEV